MLYVQISRTYLMYVPVQCRGDQGDRNKRWIGHLKCMIDKCRMLLYKQRPNNIEFNIQQHNVSQVLEDTGLYIIIYIYLHII